MPLRQFDIWAKEKRRFRRGGFVIREREFAPGTQISEQLRLDYFGGDLELSAMYWHGLSPQSRVISSTVNPLQLVDYYDRINQFGLSIIYLVGDLSFKGDYYFRETTTANIVNVSSGIEWLQYEIFDSRVDLALFLEGYYLKKVGAGQMFSPNSFDHDLFLGARFAANDTNSSKIELGIIYDWKTISHSFYARFSQNILDQWQYKIGVEWYNPTQQDMLLSGFVNDSRATFELSRFF